MVSGIRGQPYRQEAADVHISIADFCFRQLKLMGKDVVMKKDLELGPEDIQDRDLLISLGKPLTLDRYRRRRHLPPNQRRHREPAPADPRDQHGPLPLDRSPLHCEDPGREEGDTD